jgi:acyl carrier protein
MKLNIESEDLEHMLLKIEESFNIRFETDELAHVKTYGEFCEAVKAKINLDHSDTCTTQQAFNKLRASLANSLELDREKVTPDTKLTEIFPRKTRKAQLKKLERELGFKLFLLRPPFFLTGLLGITILFSFILFFIDWKYGFGAFGLSIFGFWISNKIGNELDLNTVGELTEKITRENYLKSRTNSKTINKNELDKLLEDWFVHFLGIERSELKGDAQLF